ncbi:MAG: type II secretion system F family protein, partial [Acidobacteriota bacterium]
MIELRFSAIKTNGQTLSGSLSALTFKEGKTKIHGLAAKNHLKIKSIERKSTFLYKARKGADKIVRGEQKAFAKEEVAAALSKLGYQVISINRKLFDVNMKPPQPAIVSFVKISAELLEQKLPFNEVLNLLINDIENKSLRESLKEINNELKKGADSEITFQRYQGVFGKFTAYMLGLASKSGNMTEIYRATAKFLERRMEFKKNLKSALITPIVTVFVLMLAVLFYVGYIFPETAKLFVKFKMKLPPMTAFTMQMSDFLMNNKLLVSAAILIPPLILMQLAATEKGRLVADRLILKLPVLGSL